MWFSQKRKCTAAERERDECLLSSVGWCASLSSLEWESSAKQRVLSPLSALHHSRPFRGECKNALLVPSSFSLQPTSSCCNSLRPFSAAVRESRRNRVPSYSPAPHARPNFLATIFRDYGAANLCAPASTLPFTALVNHARSNWSELTHSANAVTRPKVT